MVLKKKNKKDSKGKGKVAGWLKRTVRNANTRAMTKQEKFYHFGNVSIEYRGSRAKSCELHIIADNARVNTSEFNAKKDRGFSKRTQWLMAGSAKVIVTTKNRREKVFEINVPKADVNSRNARVVRRSSGDFTIEFTVFKNTNFNNRVEYQYKLFENSNHTGVWRHISKAKLLQDLTDTVNNPANVNQEDAGFCGATGLAYALTTSQPHRLIQFCQELYELGSFKGVERSFRASEKFRQNRAPHRLSLADYIFTGTLMEDAGHKKQHSKSYVDDKNNLRNDFNAEGNGTPGQKRWCKEILGYQNIEGLGKRFASGKQVKGLVECNQKMRAGGFAFPCIHADLLSQNNIKRKPVRWPNHWVTLEKVEIYDNKGKKMAVNSTNIKKAEDLALTIFSWGYDYIGRIPAKEYKKFVWLYITCQPFRSTNVIQQLKDVK